MTKTSIPGNRYSETRLWGDETPEFLEAQLKKVIGGQAANRRSNPRYVAEVRKLRKALQAASK